MHEAVFKAGWDRQELMQLHRGRGPEVLSLDWTLAHNDRSREIYATKRAYDYVDRRMSCYQTVMTAVVAKPGRLDGVAIEEQYPNYQKEELADLSRCFKIRLRLGQSLNDLALPKARKALARNSTTSHASPCNSCLGSHKTCFRSGGPLRMFWIGLCLHNRFAL